MKSLIGSTCSSLPGTTGLALPKPKISLIRSRNRLSRHHGNRRDPFRGIEGVEVSLVDEITVLLTGRHPKL